ncbi:CAP domain-containing protein [Bacteroidia bacterium]|nr:CAP domain-containing protein [Bacteroidia bacterium]MDB9881654.1 CAP domain-containing protein [Bacteroidia bacterium]
MKSLLRTLFIFIGLGLAASVNAQTYKMELAIEDGKFKRLEKLCLDALEDKNLKKRPEVYYYLSQAYVELSKDDLYFDKNPDAVKLAVKYMLKGKKKDKELKDWNDFEEVRNEIIKRQIDMADGQYNINKLAKAIKMYNLINQLDSTNRYAYLMSGKSSIGYLDSSTGEAKFKNLLQWYAEDIKNNVLDKEQSVDPYVYFADKYWNAGKYDSAKYIIVEGRKLFDNDPKLSFFERKVTLDQIKDMPPSSLMLDYVQEVLIHSPTDKDFLHKENSVYIYLIKNKIVANQTVDADTLINKFVREKVAKSSHKKYRLIKNTDVFVEKKSENVLWKLSKYFQTYSHLETAKHVLDKYISSTASSNSSDDIAKRWDIITNYAFETKSLPFAGFVLQQAISKYPNNNELLQTRAKVIAEKEVVATNVDEQGALYSLMKDEFAKDSSKDNKDRIVAINDKYIGLLTAANRFSTAKDIMKEQMEYAPELDHSDRLRFIAKEDFYQNYFLTRTKGKDIDGKNISPYIWNGDRSGCNAGSIDIDIQSKVANRINYFRRNAGVPEVLFDEATNEYCQEAALMMMSNNKLEHDPPRTWRCWTNEGAYAAKHSLLIKDANTSMAVTYIMDDKNPSAGNRRWLLYPNGKVYGHGSTDNIAVIWALDDSGSTDTAQYMDLPVTWPPQGDVPQLMMFSNWTFSIYRDLNDAKVEVKQDGKVIDVTVEKFVRGYGAPTLVFKPAIVKTALPSKSNFDVTVTLSGGRKYNYTVRSFYYDPGK